MKTKLSSKDKRKDRQGNRAATHRAEFVRVEDSLPYASFEVTNFRCFDTFKIDSFSRVNLITGLNNSGKTTLLEALFLHLGSTNPSLALIVNSWRGLNIVREPAEDQWTSLFWKFRDTQPIKLAGTSAKGSHSSLKISVEPSSSALRGERQYQQQTELISSPQRNIIFEYFNEAGRRDKVKGTPVFVKKDNIMTFELRLEPHLPRTTTKGMFISGRHGSDASEEIERFSGLRKKEKDSILLDALMIIEPRLKKLEILNYQGVSFIHGHLDGYDEPVPCPLLGDGVRRSLTILLAIGAAENGVVLVDEIENGIHHSAMKSLWSVIAKAAKTFNCQVFATTHSDECIRAGHDAFKDSTSYDLKLYRLDRRDSSIQAVMYDQETLDTALSIPLEVRGWPEK